MERTIKIGESELKLRSSVLTIITYKNTFGSDSEALGGTEYNFQVIPMQVACNPNPSQ